MIEGRGMRIHTHFEGRFLGCISQSFPPRKWAIRIVTHRVFEWVVLAAILVNSAFLALDTNEPGLESTTRGRVLKITGTFFAAFFASEIILKIFAMGLFRAKKAFFRDLWNIFDFVIVVLSILALLPSISDVSSLRLFRILRPLRSVSVSPKMRRLVTTLIRAFPKLTHVLILMVFFLIIYGIIGVNFFKGKLDRRCAWLRNPLNNDTFLEDVGCKPGDNPSPDCDIDHLLAQGAFWEPVEPGDDKHFWEVGRGLKGIVTCSAPLEKSFPKREDHGDGHKCNQEQWCVPFENPKDGLMSFDNILWAWLYLFNVMSTEGWAEGTYTVMGAVGTSVWVYFVSIVLLCAYLFLPLNVAILFSYYIHAPTTESANLLAIPESSHVESSEHVNDGEDSAREYNEVRDVSERDEYESILRPAKIEKDPPPYLMKVEARTDWWGTFVHNCGRFFRSSAFDRFGMVMIAVNTLVLAARYHNMPATLGEIYQWINVSLSLYFGVEMVLKVFFVGPKKYAADGINIFDAVVVPVSLIELAFFASGLGQGSFLSVLRTLRLVRIVRLIKGWRELKKILSTFLQSFGTLSHLTLLLFFFLYTSALLGMQLFGFHLSECDYVDGAMQKCPDNVKAVEGEGCPPHRDCYFPCSEEYVGYFINLEDPNGSASGVCQRYGDETLIRLGPPAVSRAFDTFWLSFLHVFAIVTIEDWDSLMYSAMDGTNKWAIIYFIAVLGIGAYVLMSLFVAVILSYFSGPESKGGGEEESQPTDKAKGPPESVGGQLDMNGTQEASTVRKNEMSLENGGTVSIGEKPLHEKGQERRQEPVLYGNSLFLFSPRNRFRRVLARVVRSNVFEMVVVVLVIANAVVLAMDSPEVQGSRRAKVLEDLNFALLVIFAVELVLRIIVEGFAFHAHSYVRNGWNVLDLIVVAAGIISAVIPESGAGTKELGALNALRALRTLRPLRIAYRAPGLRTITGAFLKAFPAIGNFLLVLLFLYLVFGIIGMNIFQGSFRACFETADPKTQGYLDADALNVAGMDKEWCEKGQHVVLLPNITQAESAGFNFGLDVQRWVNGETVALDGAWECSERPNVEEDQEFFLDSKRLETRFSGAKFECIPVDSAAEKYGVDKLNSFKNKTVLDHEWRNPDFPVSQNFDNIGRSMLSLFEIGTIELWLFSLDYGMATRESGEQPKPRTNLAAGLFFVVFILIVGLYATNLFTGLLIDKFNEIKEREGSSYLLLTERQRRWVEAHKLARIVRPPRSYLKPPEGTWQHALFRIVVSYKFDAFILTCVIVNLGFLCSQHLDQSDAWDRVLKWQNVAFTSVFGSEAILKLVAFGICGYFRNAWNAFDFAIVMLSIIGIAVTFGSSSDVTFLSMFRVFRAFRIFRFVPSLKGLRKVTMTLMSSLPGLWNVATLMFIFMWVYAVMGMQIFGFIRNGPWVKRHVNFENFPNAMLTLFRVTIGEDWNGIMWDTMIRNDCVYMKESDTWLDIDDSRLEGLEEGKDFENRCGPHPSVALIYWISYVILVAYALANLVIAVVVDNFQEIAKDDFEPARRPITRDKLLAFSDAWSRFDHLARMRIEAHKLPHLIMLLESPLGTADSQAPLREAMNLTLQLDLPLAGEETTSVPNERWIRVLFQSLSASNEGAQSGAPEVEFYETIMALVRNAIMKERLEPHEEEVVLSVLRQVFGNTQLNRLCPRPEDFTVAHFLAAVNVQAAMRGMNSRRRRRVATPSIPSNSPSH